MSKAAHQRWTNAERQFASILREFLILDARRITKTRFESKPDIEIPSHLDWIFDSKYSLKNFLVNRMVDKAEALYNKNKDWRTIIFTKGYKEVDGKCTLNARLFAMLLSFWLGYSDKETLWNIYMGKKDES